MTLPLRSLLGLALLFVWLGAAAAQTPGASPTSTAASDFIAAASNSAMLQKQAAAIAAAGDVRPEVKTFAKDMVKFRDSHLQRLATIAAGQSLALPPLTFEQQVLIDNLKPLDFLALTRRYMELQVQALDQEVRAYETARSHIAPVEPLATEYLPLLMAKLAKAREILQAVQS